MSAQTGAVRKPMGEPPEPVTPVIIKSGGGSTDLSSGASLVEISSPMMNFAELVAGPTWESSQSTLPGRVTHVTIKDGADFVCTRIEPSDELVSIQIAYALDQLVAQESIEPETKKVVLLFNSPEVPFSDPDEKEWSDSSATFPNPITSVTVMIGDRKDLFHQCKSHDVRAHISFDLMS